MPKPVGAVVPLYGAKRQMAPTIVHHIGKPRSYLAPFVGSCAVELAMPEPPRTGILNDLSGNLINLIRVVAHDEFGPDLFAGLQRVAFCEELYRDAVAWLVKHPCPNDEAGAGAAGLNAIRAHNYFVAAWCGRNGLIGTTDEFRAGFCIRYTSNGGDPATRFAAAVNSVPDWWRILRAYTITRRDGIDLCERFEDAEGACVYADPPYLDKQGVYTHDFAADDHTRLAVALNRFKKTRVVLSYYANPRLAELYPGWRLVPVGVPKNLAVRSGAAPAPEVLLINQAA